MTKRLSLATGGSMIDGKRGYAYAASKHETFPLQLQLPTFTRLCQHALQISQTLPLPANPLPLHSLHLPPLLRHSSHHPRRLYLQPPQRWLQTTLGLPNSTPLPPLSITTTTNRQFKLLISSVLSIFNFLLTTLTHCCYGLSPRLSLTGNTLLLILWCISLGLLSWSMAHTILTSCTTKYWGTSTGISVCRTFKALFVFTVFGTVASIAAVWLDIVVRRRQTRLGKYDAMGSSTGLVGDVKLQDRNSGMSTGLVAENDDPWNMPEPYSRQNRGHHGGSDEFEDGYGYHDETSRLDYGHGYGDGNPYYGDHHHVGASPPDPVPTPAWNHRAAGYGDGGYYAYPGYNHLPEQTSYDSGAYR